MHLRLLAAPLVLPLLAACSQPGAPRPHGGDANAELSVSGDQVAELFEVSGAYVVSPLLENPEGGTRVGFLVDVAAGAGELDLEARGFDADGDATGWLPATFTWAEDEMRVARVDLGRVVTAAEVRLPRAQLEGLKAITFSLVVPGDGVQDPGFDALASKPVTVDLAPSPERSQALLAGVNPRSAWGARATGCGSLNQTKTRITVHHTAGPSTQSPDWGGRLRGIQNYHMDVQGWCDIGYHYLVTTDGQTWEGRPAQYLGTHVANQNTNNLGVSFVGCFQSSGCSNFTPFDPPAAMMQAGGELIGAAAANYGITVSGTSVIGHRDNPGASTACPGANLHGRLGELRDTASGAVAPPTTGKVQGVVWDLAVTTDASQSQALGARREGATLTVQGGPTTTSRPDDAYWSFELDPGTYTITASLEGYEDASREVQVTAGAEQWASIGVAPVDTSVSLTVFVFDAESEAGIGAAQVEVTGSDPAFTGEGGEVALSLNAGSVTVKVGAEGYEPAELVRDLAAGSERIEVGLTPVFVEEPAEQEPTEQEPGQPGQEMPGDPVDEEPQLPAEGQPGGGGEQDVELASVRPDGERKGVLAQGCICVGGDSDTTDPTRGFALAGLLCLGLLLRRRSGARL